MKEERNRSSRRRFLKGSGMMLAGTGGLSVLGNVTAKQSDIEIYEQSLRLRQRNGWDLHKWREYLSHRGLKFKYYDQSHSLPRQGVGTQKADCYQTTLSLTYVEPRYVGYDSVNFTWNFDLSDVDDEPKLPRDFASIGFQSDHYSKRSSGEYVKYGPHTSQINDMESEGPTGVMVEYDDLWHYEAETDPYDPNSLESHFDLYVEPNWEDYTQSERKIYVDYYHTWATASLDGITIGAAGPSATISPSHDQWVLETEANEYEMDDGDSYSYQKSGTCN